MDEVEYFRFVLTILLLSLPFVLFTVAFILDKVRTALYKPLDDEEEYKLDGLRHFWCENVGACKYPTHDDACHLCFNEWLDNGKKERLMPI